MQDTNTTTEGEDPRGGFDVSLDGVVERYIQMRDKKTALKKAYEADVAQIDSTLERCEAFFLANMNRLGLESLPTKFGVPYKSRQTSVRVADPVMFRDWVQSGPPPDAEDTRWVCLDVKANKTAVAAFKEANDDLPPGLNWREEVIVNVRRS